MERNYKFDNLKALLIFLVVFCHFCELFSGTLKYRLYLVIYTFHMPVFVFISGYFARFNLKNIIKKQVYPYVIFQLLSCLFLGSKIQFFTPYWIMWYIFCSIFWNFSLFFAKKRLFLCTIISVFAALFIGFADKIGNSFSLSRMFFFYPFFLSGALANEKKILENIKFTKLTGVMALILALFLSIIIIPKVNTSWLYHAHSYSYSGETMLWRAYFLFLGMLWCASLVLLFPKKKIKILSTVGRYSICIYLLHGFIFLSFKLYINPFVFSPGSNLLLAVLLSFVICLAVGNKYVFNFLNPLFVLPIPLKEHLYKLKKM